MEDWMMMGRTKNGNEERWQGGREGGRDGGNRERKERWEGEK